MAIKVLPEAMAQDADRIARFRREAELLATVNHPNVASVYGLEDTGGVVAIVMELVEGPTLADRIAPGPLALADALPIARQIADAVEAAHEKGVVHRDLKPANVKVTADGAVKVLDFGLAKLQERPGPAASLSMSPTISMHATKAGMILGTAAYMSPEQARGKTVDKRTDVWAFGCVLYEMLTGRQAFEGEEASDVLARIIEREPDFGALPAATPRAIRRLLQRCLEKDAKRRLRDIADARIEIDEALTAPPEEASAPAPSAIAAHTVLRGRWQERVWLPWAVAALATGAAAALAFVMVTRTATPARTVRFDVATPESVVSIDAPRLSPDGRYLAFNATDSEGKTRVWIRQLNSLTAQPMPGTDGATRPFWSPDSRFVAFMADGKLKKIDVGGGPAQKICDAPSGADGSWGSAGVILYDGRNTDPIYRVSALGGTPTVAVKADASRKENGAAWPEFLPDGRHFLYLAMAEKPEDYAYRVGSIDSADSQPLASGQTQVAFAPPNHLLFARDKTLMAQPFDLKSLKTTGEPVPLAERIGTNGVGQASFSVSRDGTLAYRTGDAGSQLFFVNREGREIETVGDVGDMFNPALSRDGSRIAYALADPRSAKVDLWIRDLARGVSSRFTFGPGNNSNPVWSPDGSRVAFNSSRGATTDVFEKPASGQGDETLLLKSDQTKVPTDWSRDGRYIAYQTRDPKTDFDLWVLPTSGDRKPIPVVVSSATEMNLIFSPDSRLVAYRSNESGPNQIYVQTFPRATGKWQVSNAGGSDPSWRADGKELIYRALDQRLMSVEIRAGENFQASVPRPLFVARVQTAGTARNRYAAAADGQRFLLVAPPGREAMTPTTVVLNWSAELGR